jgi:hypothetical protein
MSGYMVAIGPCWGCKVPFPYDPDRVTSLLIDPVTQTAPDLGGDPARAQREPLCPRCCKTVNVLRARAGLELLDETDSSLER